MADYIAVMFQVRWALHVLADVYNVMHNDLHAANIVVRRAPRQSQYVTKLAITYEGSQFSVQLVSGVVATILDYARCGIADPYRTVVVPGFTRSPPKSRSRSSGAAVRALESRFSSTTAAAVLIASTPAPPGQSDMPKLAQMLETGAIYLGITQLVEWTRYLAGLPLGFTIVADSWQGDLPSSLACITLHHTIGLQLEPLAAGVVPETPNRGRPRKWLSDQARRESQRLRRKNAAVDHLLAPIVPAPASGMFIATLIKGTIGLPN